jgi:hypothetical protein
MENKIKRTNVHLIRIPNGAEKENGPEEILRDKADFSKTDERYQLSHLRILRIPKRINLHKDTF